MSRQKELETEGAFYSTKNSGLNFRNFRMSNGTVFSTRQDRSRSIPAWVHFPLRITRENAEGSWWSGCLNCRIKLLYVEKFNTHSEFNFSLTFMRETYELLLRESMQSERTDPQEIRNDQSTISQEIRSYRFRFRSRIGSNYGRSFCIQCSVDSKYSPPSCSFSRLKELGPIQT